MTDEILFKNQSFKKIRLCSTQSKGINSEGQYTATLKKEKVTTMIAVIIQRDANKWRGIPHTWNMVVFQSN